MLFQFMKNRSGANQGNYLSQIQHMLEGTWDLARQFPVEAGAEDAQAVSAFNTLFGKLNQTMTRILKSVVVMASLAPDLFAFSKSFKEKTGEQEQKITAISKAGVSIAKGVETIAGNTRALSDDSRSIKEEVEKAMALGEKSMTGFAHIKAQVDQLVTTIQILKENSSSIGSISDVINSISDETNILSLNARIEAARGQTDGKGFKVIAEEIGSLARQSKEATQDIQEKLSVLSEKIHETVAAVRKVEGEVGECQEWITSANTSLEQVCGRVAGLSEGLADIQESTTRQSRDVKLVSGDIVEIEKSVAEQGVAVETIFTIADKINDACDGMILDTGVFHLSGHQKSRTIAQEIARDPLVCSPEQASREKALVSHMDQNDFIELAYITDKTGRQVTRNLYSPKVKNRENLDPGLGNDWSKKEWFQIPAGTKTTFVSEVYRSAATDCFCFTVSVPLIEGGRLEGVLGIDVNFKDMLDI